MCKICTGEKADDGMGWKTHSCEPYPTIPIHRRLRRRQMPHFEENIPVSACWLAEVTARMDTFKFGEFVCEWMQLSAKTRKTLSYSGAVMSCEGDPVHYYSRVANQKYFDPGNYVYAQALTIMCPRLMSEVSWNIEKKGDICEGIMGAHYEEKNVAIESDRKRLRREFGRELEVMSEIIDKFAWHTYNMLREVGDDNLQQWVDWVIDISMWMRDTPGIPPRVIVEQVADDLPLGRRDKYLGHLIEVIVEVVD